MLNGKLNSVFIYFCIRLYIYILVFLRVTVPRTIGILLKFDKRWPEKVFKLLKNCKEKAHIESCRCFWCSLQEKKAKFLVSFPLKLVYGSKIRVTNLQGNSCYIEASHHLLFVFSVIQLKPKWHKSLREKGQNIFSAVQCFCFPLFERTDETVKSAIVDTGIFQERSQAAGEMRWPLKYPLPPCPSPTPQWQRWEAPEGQPAFAERGAQGGGQWGQPGGLRWRRRTVQRGRLLHWRVCGEEGEKGIGGNQSDGSNSRVTSLSFLQTEKKNRHWT